MLHAIIFLGFLLNYTVHRQYKINKINIHTYFITNEFSEYYIIKISDTFQTK